MNTDAVRPLAKWISSGTLSSLTRTGTRCAQPHPVERRLHIAKQIGTERLALIRDAQRNALDAPLHVHTRFP